MNPVAGAGGDNRVLLVFDRPKLSLDLARLLTAVALVEAVHVANLPDTASPPLAIVCDLDLRSAENLRALQNGLSRRCYRSVPRFFVTGEREGGALRASALGATDTLSRPFDPEQVLGRFRLLFAEAFEREIAAEAEPVVREGLAGAGAVIRKMFEDVPAGLPFTAADMTADEHAIMEAVTAARLDGWLKLVYRHHAQSYRHCFSVTGVALAFAQTLGMSEADQRRILRAALVHDVGKAFVPLAILDKPGKLTAGEMDTMRRHPRLGFEVLEGQGGFSPEVLDVVLHHHEMLDGSGYPDRLSGGEIADLVRIVTVADIFSALIEERSYKAPLPRPDAYAVLRDMSGKLDPDLVRAFEPVAMAA
jgi:putative nucleotidyltransferase with HDIG domain